MGNHQHEIADAVQSEGKNEIYINHHILQFTYSKGYCHSTIPEKLIHALSEANFFDRVSYPAVDYNAYPAMLDQTLGWT